jgi:putative peptidoglycan lipid II flippase
VVAGSLLAAVLQLLFPLRHFRLQLRLDPEVKRFLWLCLPLVLGAAYFRLDPLVDRYLASGLPTGSVAHLGYASRIVSALLAAGTGGLAIVAFPNFAIQRAAGRPEDLAGEVSHALRCLSVILVPIILGLGCYSRPVIRDLYQRGLFTADDTQAVALLVLLYLVMVMAAAFGDVAAKVFYAMSDTRTPTLIGCFGFTLGVLLKILLTRLVGVAGIVAATSAYFLLNSVIMSVLIFRRLGPQSFSGVAGAAMRSLAASIIAVLAVLPVLQIPLPMNSLVGAACGAGVYFAALLLLRDELALRLWGYLVSRGQTR